MTGTEGFLGGVLGSLASALQPVVDVLLMRPSSTTSIAAMLAAGLIGFVFLRHHLTRRGRAPSARRIARMLLPAKYLRNPSHRLDIGMWFTSICIAGLLMTWMVVSHAAVRKLTGGLFASMLGEPGPAALPDAAAVVIVTVTLFLAYELSYWLDHYLAHTIPFLWEFHKVHHSAEALSPLTNFRVHPVDSLVFANVSAIILGITSGALDWGLGKSVAEVTVIDLNVLLLAGVYLVAQLQHSQLWIPFTGVWGKLLISPAHHQIHHSVDERHFNRNMGSTLAIFDWMFGTLCIPSTKRERLTFGVAPRSAAPHSLVEGLITPFQRAAEHLVPGEPVRMPAQTTGSSPAA